jgi:alpha-ketoglutarate-dependent taurine dioxygenase
MHVRKLTESLGAEITGVELLALLEPANLPALSAAWARYGVLVFPKQAVSDAEQIQFARAFGTLTVFSSAAGKSGTEINHASNLDTAGHLFAPDDERSRLLAINAYWHIDGCYRSQPNKGSVLRAVVIPDHGGETVFANLAASYTALPKRIQQGLNTVYCRHSFAHMLRQCDMTSLAPGDPKTLPAQDHPLVWKHRNGLRSLFLSPPYMEQIRGLTYAQTQWVVEWLVRWATQRKFVYMHRWRHGDVILWDNRWTMHKVAPYDLASMPRVMHGAVLVGDATVEPP